MPATRPQTILLLRHSSSVGPGLLADFLKRRGLTVRMLSLDKGDALPEHAEEFGAIIGLGGEMNVNDDRAFPFLKDEAAFVRRSVKAGVPYLGLCLGGQMLTRALSGRVTKNDQKEIGPYEIALNDAGKQDPLFAGFPERFPFCQWHGDTFSELPEGATLLASSAACTHQAFRVGETAYGLQFHPEVTSLVLEQWCEDFDHDLESTRHATEVKARYDAVAAECVKHSERLFRNFLLLSNVIAGGLPG